MYQLYIANKNYSSWSLRPWMLLRQLEIPFIEHLVPFGDPEAWQALRNMSPSGRVPCLLDGATTVWDSLAITEYLADSHPGVWPSAARARAWARCAAAEMHSGFPELRSCCAMNCGVRVRLHDISVALQQEVGRLAALWNDGLQRFGGPFLAGKDVTAADAFYAPVAFRVQSYGLALEQQAAAYARRLLELPAVREWYLAALDEPMRDPPHEQRIKSTGTLLQDLRRTDQSHA